MSLMPSCDEVREQLTEYLEGDLPIRKRVGIRLHLMMCKACAGMILALKALPAIAKEILRPPSEAPPQAKSAFLTVLARIKAEKSH